MTLSDPTVEASSKHIVLFPADEEVDKYINKSRVTVFFKEVLLDKFSLLRL